MIYCLSIISTPHTENTLLDFNSINPTVLFTKEEYNKTHYLDLKFQTNKINLILTVTENPPA
jgi:hypothetical protein